MDKQNKYLDEEKYQKINKKVNKVGTILLIIGLIMIIPGIVINILTMTTWDEPTLCALGGFLSVFGIGFLAFGGQAKFFSHLREINAYISQQRMPIAKEIIEEMSPSVSAAAKNIAKSIKEGLKDDK